MTPPTSAAEVPPPGGPDVPPAADPEATPWARRTFAALAHRNYRLFFVGMAISSVGGWARSAAQQKLVWDLTRDSAWLGWVGAASLLAIALATTPGGVLADRLDRRRVLMALQLVQGACSGTLATLTALGTVTPQAVLANAIALGLAGGAEMPFRQSYVVELVGKGGLRNAVALNSIMFNLPLALGPAVAGEIMARTSVAWVFAFDAVSYLAAFVGFALIRTPPRPRDADASVAGDGYLAGARYVRGHPESRSILVLLSLAMILGWAYTSQLAAYATEHLHADARGYGFLFSSSGIGACLGAAWVAGRPARRPRVAMRRALGAFALSLVAMGLFPTYAVAYSARVVAGFSMICFFATGNSTVQLGLPDAVRGRVMALWSFTFSLSLGAGQVLFGFAARHASVPATFVGGGALLFAVAALSSGAAAYRSRSTT